MFSLAFENRTRLNFALELDRGTMDIKSRQLVGKSSFRRKLLGYYQLWKEGLHTNQWGFNAFRVLTVTPSESASEKPQWSGPFATIETACLSIARKLAIETADRHTRSIERHQLTPDDALYGLKPTTRLDAM